MSTGSLPKVEDIRKFSKAEVAKWLDKEGFSQYVKCFVENEIDGEAFSDLTEEDLVILGIKSVGHRRRLIQRIKRDLLKFVVESGHKDDIDEDQLSFSGSYTGSSSNSSQKSGRTSSSTASDKASEKVTIKLYYKSDVSLLSVTPNISIRKLERKASETFGRRKLQLFFEDFEGDKIRLKEQNITSILKMDHQGKVPKFRCERRPRRHRKAVSQISNVEESILESLIEAVIVMDTNGTILFTNSSAQKMWGFKKEELAGQNVKILMPTNYASRHQRYIENYLKTGKSSVIGKSRKVMAKRKDGSQFAVDLSVNERKDKTGHVFTGMARVVQEEKTDESNNYNVLSLLMEAAIVTSDSGKILFMNKPCLELFGYKEEVILGRNVSDLMPSPFRENHYKYMQNYLDTGEKHVINTTRRVVAEDVKGEIFPVSLSVSETVNKAGDKTFTGFFRKEKALQQTNLTVLKKERGLVNQAMTPGVIMDAKCRIQAFNTAAQALFGYDLAEVLGENVKILCNPKDRQRHDEHVQSYLRTGVSKIIGKEREVVGSRKDGTQLRTVLTLTKKLDEKGDPLFTAFFHPISEKRN